MTDPAIHLGRAPESSCHRVGAFFANLTVDEGQFGHAGITVKFVGVRCVH